PPGDVDIITFFRRPPAHQEDKAWSQFVSANKQMFSPKHTKITYSCDAYAVDLNLQTEDIVNHTRYWFGLFSHKKITNQWKGIVQINLDSKLDTAALLIISEKEASL